MLFHKNQKHECYLNMHDDALHSSEQIHNKKYQLLLKTIEPVHNITGFGLSKNRNKAIIFSLITVWHYSSPRFQYSPQNVASFSTNTNSILFYIV